MIDKIIDDKEIFRQIIERDVGNLYESLRDYTVEAFPQYRSIVQGLIKSNESKWLDFLQTKVDMLVEASFTNPESTLEEALKNANNIVNGIISNWLSSSLGLPKDVVTIAINEIISPYC